jgi:UDP-N-acetylmuramoyl-L-alanyl-D-glutamate--2,6-diaminopimelate ligase
MLLSELVSGFHIVPAGADPSINALTEDSRRVRPGTLFVAVPGRLLDGHAYIADAVARGAAAIVAERTGAIPPGVPVVRVPSSRVALAMLAARFYGTTASSLSLIGFTGTFGKTSTSEILRALLDAAGCHTGVLGSLGARYRDFYDPGLGLTTPAPVELHRALRGFVGAGATTVILEVTSHALMLGRINGLRFDGGLLGAIMPGEHTDFHRTYEDYVEAKRLFVAHLKPDALLAYDADNLAARQVAASRHRPPEDESGAAGHRHRHRVVPDPGEAAVSRPPPASRTIGLSLEGRYADVQVYDTTLDGTGTAFSLGGPLLGAQSGTRMRTPLLGRGHLKNVSLALTYALGTGLPVSAAAPVVAGLVPLRRRMETYQIDGRLVLDDTAAHPDSLRATFDVAASLPHRQLAVVYAVRGRRGVETNRQNALAIADLCSVHGAEPLFVTSSVDATGPADVVMPPEIDATRQALVSRGRRFVWHEALADALIEALERTSPSDLILLVGAQGMNEAKSLLLQASSH